MKRASELMVDAPPGRGKKPLPRLPVLPLGDEVVDAAAKEGMLTVAVLVDTNNAVSSLSDAVLADSTAFVSVQLYDRPMSRRDYPYSDYGCSDDVRKFNRLVRNGLRRRQREGGRRYFHVDFAEARCHRLYKVVAAARDWFSRVYYPAEIEHRVSGTVDVLVYRIDTLTSMWCRVNGSDRNKSSIVDRVDEPGPVWLAHLGSYVDIPV